MFTVKCLDGVVLDIQIGISLHFLQYGLYLLLQIPRATKVQDGA